MRGDNANARWHSTTCARWHSTTCLSTTNRLWRFSQQRLNAAPLLLTAPRSGPAASKPRCTAAAAKRPGSTPSVPHQKLLLSCTHHVPSTAAAAGGTVLAGIHLLTTAAARAALCLARQWGSRGWCQRLPPQGQAVPHPQRTGAAAQSLRTAQLLLTQLHGHGYRRGCRIAPVAPVHSKQGRQRATGSKRHSARSASCALPTSPGARVSFKASGLVRGVPSGVSASAMSTAAEKRAALRGSAASWDAQKPAVSEVMSAGSASGAGRWERA